MESTVALLHSMGLGFGLYGDRGTHECNGVRPGNLGFEAQDAAFFARMEIDWFKQDSCDATGVAADAIAEYTVMSEALWDATRAPGIRPIWFAMCGWQPFYAPPPAGRHIANSWRVGPDTGAGWDVIMKNVANTLPLGGFAGPTESGGGWNDLCLLLNPGVSTHTLLAGTHSLPGLV
jgi:alpha-galactosidase